MKSFKISIPKTLNLLIYSLPLVFILGNFLVNIVVLIFSIIGIIHYKKEVFIFDKYNPLSLIIIFFILILFSTSIEYLTGNIGTNNLIKSFVFLRYLIFLMVLRCMIINNDLDLKKTLLVSFIFSSFVACDVIFQYFVGVDIFGNKPVGGVFFTGVFGDEAVAGGYIQKFSIIGLFSLILLLSNKNKKFTFITYIFLIICFFAILLSNNRIPTIMFCIFLFALGLFLLFKKSNFKNGIIIIFSVLTLILWASTNQAFKIRYQSFVGAIPKLSEIFDELKREYPEYAKYKNTGVPFYHTETFKKFENYEDINLNKNYYPILVNYTGHTQIYITSLEIFGENVLIGRGIKSFRHSCTEKIHKPNRTCANHAHHYYLEILNDVGILGFIIIFSAIILLTIKNYRKYYRVNKKFNKVFYLTFYAVFISLIIELFPFRSQGSFFSVLNASFIFFLLGIFCGFYDLKPKKTLKKIFDF